MLSIGERRCKKVDGSKGEESKLQFLNRPQFRLSVWSLVWRLESKINFEMQKLGFYYQNGHVEKSKFQR